MCEMSWPGLRAPRKCCVGPFGVLCTKSPGSDRGARKFLARLENQLENFRAWDAVGWAGLGLNHSSLLFPGVGQDPCMGRLTELTICVEQGEGLGKRAFSWAEATQRPHGVKAICTPLVGLCSKPPAGEWPGRKRALEQQGKAVGLPAHPSCPARASPNPSELQPPSGK